MFLDAWAAPWNRLWVFGQLSVSLDALVSLQSGSASLGVSINQRAVQGLCFDFYRTCDWNHLLFDHVYCILSCRFSCACKEHCIGIWRVFLALHGHCSAWTFIEFVYCRIEKRFASVHLPFFILRRGVEDSGGRIIIDAAHDCTASRVKRCAVILKTSKTIV